MASTPSYPAVNAFNVTAAYTKAYTLPSPYSRAAIDAVVFNNYSGSNVTISVRIAQSGAAGDLNEIITAKTIRANDNYLAPAMIGQALLQGGFVEVKCSAASSVNMAMTVTLID